MGNVFESIGYHQSSIDNAQSSVRWQSFHIGTRQNLWLGDGIYFWEQYNDAVWWDGRNKNPAIVSAHIKCQREFFLDLDNKDDKKELKKYYDLVSEEMKKADIDLKFLNDDLVTPFLCNYYKKTYDILLIRYSFPRTSGRPQMCATNTTILSNINMVSFFVGGKYVEA